MFIIRIQEQELHFLYLAEMCIAFVLLTQVVTLDINEGQRQVPIPRYLQEQDKSIQIPKQ